MEELLKKSYARLVRFVRQLFGSSTAQLTFDGSSGTKFATWLRSLLAIYDIDEMNRQDLAWWQLDALAEVDRFLKLRENARIFEYGSGASTLWLARRAASVTSVEHDSGWFDLVAERLKAYPNATLRHVVGKRNQGDPNYVSGKPGAEGLNFEDYVHAIDNEAPFDLIVIDGRCREMCIAAAKSKLKPGGLIVFDNSRRGRYQQALMAPGFAIKRYRGMTACLPYPDETTILTKA